MKARLPQGFGGGGPSNLQQLARQAQKMQEQMEAATPELEEKEWKWMYNCVMESLFYHLDDEKKDWTKMRELYTRFRKAALGHMSRGQRWRYRYVRCL